MVPVWMILSDHQGRDITQCQITQKRYKIEPYLQWRTNRKSYTIYRAVPFSMTFDNPLPRFQGHAIFDAEYFRNGTGYIHSFSGIQIEIYTLPTQQCHFEWPWVTLSDLAKYLMTRSVARPLCDSWASCYIKLLFVVAVTDLVCYTGV